MINVCIFGAGAIGGYIGCSLSKAGANVSLIARGPHKEAIKKKWFNSNFRRKIRNI